MKARRLQRTTNGVKSSSNKQQQHRNRQHHRRNDSLVDNNDDDDDDHDVGSSSDDEFDSEFDQSDNASLKSLRKCRIYSSCYYFCFFKRKKTWLDEAGNKTIKRLKAKVLLN